MNLNYDDAPKISVIVSAQTIESGDPRTVESIIAQEFSDFELLIVGDKNADKTSPKCLRLASSNAKVKLFKYKSEGLNVRATRLIGLANARGKYVCFLNDNSVLLNGAFELIYRTAEDNDADVVHSIAFLEQIVDASTSNLQIVIRAEEPQRKGFLGADRTQLLIDHLVDRKFNAAIGLNLCRREFLLSNIAVLKDKLDEDEKFFAALLNLAERFYCLPKFFCLQIKQSPPVDKPAEPFKPIFVNDLNNDEIRDGFFVTSHRKKLWNVQLQLIMEVDRICQKHGIKWFAHAGTLLGAARHQGFIPWDDDVDIAMLRPDFNKFVEIAPRELKSNYFLDFWYNYRLEGEKAGDDEQLTFVSNRVADTIRKNKWWWPIRTNFLKLRDVDTMMIQWKTRKNFNQGIWIDIFPFDPAPPFDDEQHLLNFKMGKEMMLAASNRDEVQKMLDEDHEFVTPIERLKAVLELPFKQRALAVEEHLRKTYFESPNVVFFASYKEGRYFPRRIFDKVVRLPFELTELSCPVDYDEMLKVWFGDWHKIVFAPGHAKAYSDNISYRDYFRLSKY